MGPQIFDSFPVLSEEEITGFENTHQIRLPSEYRRFLLEHNGGSFEPPDFTIPRPALDDKISMLTMFAGIHGGYSDSLARYLITHAGRVPRNMLAIARDIFGNVVCIAIDGEDFGKIYWWSHELEDTYLIAENFDGFLDSFFLSDEGDDK